MNVTTKLQKWGNSSGVRLPKKVLEAAQFEDDQSFSLSMRGASILLTPVDKDMPITLESVLRDATPESFGGEFNWGPDVGNEIIDD